MLARLGLLFAAAALLLVSVSASDVLILDPSNFDDYVGGDLPVFVEFFAPSANQPINTTATVAPIVPVAHWIVCVLLSQVVRSLQGSRSRVRGGSHCIQISACQSRISRC